MEKMSGNVKNVKASHANKFGRKRKEKFKVFKPRTSTSNVEKQEIKKLQDLYETIDSTVTGKFFRDFPLSQKTLRGLKENGYLKPTEIQRESIMLSLRGLDILGAAKTGSGKTLAFLIPILERLYCSQWTRLDGVGALIITPTRELAYQIFETLRKVGKYHDFSAGLIIGGKDLKFERKRMDQVNIVICTPGRLLQHMDENPLFDCANLQILVLDEADRCLDMGFEETMNNIIQNLPTERQTLLFSATQTRSVKDLARLSLKDPMYVSVHEHAKHSTPEALKQSYIVVGLEEKLSMLWSFLRNHTKHKILVFLSSCKQVKYFYEAFCRLRPGVSLLALYGTLHQMRRMAIYESFCRKSHAVLFATDIAARGLDFPAVHWVVQLDCPEDAATYIHRAGRTARYQKGGESLLVLLPSEKESMLERLEAAKIPINEIKINENKLQNPWRKLEALLARDKELKASAQRAFVAYVKSVFLMKDKSVFDVKALNTDAFSRSLGLAIPPRIRFLQRMEKQQSKSHKKEDNDPKSESDPEVSDDDETENDNVKEIKRSPKLQDKASKHEKSFGFRVDGSSDSDEDILKVKRKNHELDDDTDEQLPGMEVNASDGKGKKRILTKAAIAKRILKKKIVANQKKVFDEEGNVILNHTKEKVSDLAREYENEDAPVGGIDIEKAKLALKEEDQIDKKLFRERVKAKHKEERRKQKEANKNLKKVDEEVEEDEESYSSSDSEGPDLSWLPDPDKVFKKKSEENGENENSDGENEKSGSGEESDRSGSEEENDKSGSEKGSKKFGSDDEEDNSGAEESSLEDEKPSPTWKNKRKSSATHENYGVKRQKNIHRLKNPNLTLEEEETLAMQLLRH